MSICTCPPPPPVADDDDSYAEEDSDESDYCDENDVELDNDEDDDDPYPYQSAELYLNDGRTRLAGQTRFKRFRVVDGDRLSLSRPCEQLDSDQSQCKLVKVGQGGWFETKKSPKTLVQGTVLFLGLSLKS